MPCFPRSYSKRAQKRLVRDFKLPSSGETQGLQTPHCIYLKSLKKPTKKLTTRAVQSTVKVNSRYWGGGSCFNKGEERRGGIQIRKGFFEAGFSAHSTASNR